MIKDILEILQSINEGADFENSTDFLEDGLLDSFEMVNLVELLEEHYDIEISGSDIIPENFMSLETIKEMLIKYLGE